MLCVPCAESAASEETATVKVESDGDTAGNNWLNTKSLQSRAKMTQTAAATTVT